MTRLPNRVHTSRPWRIHELTRDFRLEDVWAMPTSGGPDDFPRLLGLLAGFDPADSASRWVRTLFGIRWKLGALLRWDGAGTGVGRRVATLRDRLPADLRGTALPEFSGVEFSSVYLLDDEWAGEVANRTVHGVLHIGWVAGESGDHRGEMAVYVKPNGLVGAAYMAAITPFRRLVIYPRLLREWGELWSRSAEPAPSPARRTAVPVSPTRG